VIGLAAVLFLITFALVGFLLSKPHKASVNTEPRNAALDGHPSTVAARMAAHWPHLDPDRASADATIATKAQLRDQAPRNHYRDRTFDLRITMHRLHMSVYS
jgi:hypothetical protein